MTIISVICNVIALTSLSFYLLNENGRITKFFKR